MSRVTIQNLLPLWLTKQNDLNFGRIRREI